jgi:hypothetical protein
VHSSRIPPLHGRTVAVERGASFRFA